MLRRFLKNTLGWLLLLSLGILPGWLPVQPALAEPAIDSARDRIHPVFARNGMVVAQEALASETGLAILQQGGNAVDAAVTVGFALAVTLPQAGNLGGGGFLLTYDAAKQHSEAIDFRETAPAAAKRDTYLNTQGEVDNPRQRHSHQAAGTPGTVAGLALAHSRHGRLPWKTLVEPAIRLAGGFPVSRELAQ